MSTTVCGGGDLVGSGGLLELDARGLLGDDWRRWHERCGDLERDLRLWFDAGFSLHRKLGFCLCAWIGQRRDLRLCGIGHWIERKHRCGGLELRFKYRFGLGRIDW
jgi:hypothetical protein